MAEVFCRCSSTSRAVHVLSPVAHTGGCSTGACMTSPARRGLHGGISGQTSLRESSGRKLLEPAGISS